MLLRSPLPSEPLPPPTNWSSKLRIHLLEHFALILFLKCIHYKFRVLCVDAIIDSADTNSDWRLDFEEYKTLMDHSFQPKEKCNQLIPLAR